MANIAIFRINYKSDFILTLNSDAGWMTPFCIKFWTSAPSQAYFAGYDGETYTHCAPVDGEPTKLLVQFDDHHLPIGDLKFQIGYHFTVADFPTSVEDEVINQASVIIEVDDAPAQVMLDFNGETAPEIEFSLPAYANEAQRIANEEARIAAEQQRIANEDARIQAEETRQQNEQQRIDHETARVNEFATLKSQSQAATRDANDAATLANQKAQLAADKAALANDAATLANQKAQLAADKAALANDAAQLADEKADLAQQKAEYAQTQGGYAKDQGDYAKNQGDYAKAQGDTAQADHERAEADHGIAVDDHTQAGNDHTRAEADHGIAVDDHTQAGNDHTRAESDHGIAADDHTQAGNDHTRAESDHGIAVDDHTQAGNDHTRAESDHTRAESDHAAVEVYVDSLGAFDISAYHATGGVLAKYADLTAALGTNGENIPEGIRKGGMSVKFVQSSDNKYAQYRLMSDSFNTTVANWQGVDDVPTSGSHNVVESGGVAEEIILIEGIHDNNTVNFTTASKTLIFDKLFIKQGEKFALKASTSESNLTYYYLYYGDASSDRFNAVTFYNNYTTEFTAPRDIYFLKFIPGVPSGTTFVGGDISFELKYNGLLDDVEEGITSTLSKKVFKLSDTYTVTAGTSFDTKANPIWVNLSQNDTIYVRVVTNQNNDNTSVSIGVINKNNGYLGVMPITQNAIHKLTIPADSKGVCIGSFTPAVNDEITLEVYADAKNISLQIENNKDFSKGIASILNVIVPAGVYNNLSTIFTSKDVKVGDELYYSLRFNDENNHTNYLLIRLFDGNNNILGNYGKTTGGATTQNVYFGSFIIPSGFAYAILLTEVNNNSKITSGIIDYVYTKDSIIEKIESLPFYTNESPEVLYAETDVNDRALRTVTKDSEVHYQKQVFNNEISLNQTSYNSFVNAKDVWGVPKVDTIVLGTPEVVLSTADNEATGWDSWHIGYIQVVKISDSLFYMYYNAGGPDGWHIDSDPIRKKSMLFAYSSDGVNWTRGFPQGVTPPFGNDAPYSVMFLDKNNNTVFKPANFIYTVDDADYPFRCITSEGSTYMYKSADGFTFTEMTLIEEDQERDTQPGVIRRGNILKIYNRGWSGGYPPHTSYSNAGPRNIVVFYCDANGNLLCQESPLGLEKYYNNAAHPIDAVREVLFPTYYAGESEPIRIDCYIVDDCNIKKIDIDSNMLLGSIDGVQFLWSLAQPGLVAIEGKLYMYYYGTNVTHNNIPDTSISGRKSQVRRVEVRFNCSKLKYKQ